MEPNNFEKDFREKLNQRKIEPSNKAWDRLDAMLSVTEKKQPKKKNRWLYIAASLVGFLLVGTIFLNQKKNPVETPKNNVVIEDVVIEDVVRKDSVEKPILNTTDPGKTEIAISKKETTEKSENKGYSQPEVSKSNSNQLIINKKNQLTESSVIIKNNQEKQSINREASVAETFKNERVEQLLNTAEKSVAEHSAKPKSKIKVNASDLLNQVDGELELSFREKVITKDNKNYQTVKVALANRNQQE